MKAIEQYFHVVLFIILYKVVQTFESVDKTLVCEHSSENYQAVLCCSKNEIHNVALPQKVYWLKFPSLWKFHFSSMLFFKDFGFWQWWTPSPLEILITFFRVSMSIFLEQHIFVSNVWKKWILLWTSELFKLKEL